MGYSSLKIAIRPTNMRPILSMHGHSKDRIDDPPTRTILDAISIVPPSTKILHGRPSNITQLDGRDLDIASSPALTLRKLIQSLAPCCFVLVVGNFVKISHDHIRRSAGGPHLTVIQPDRLFTDRLDRPQVVGNQQQSATASAELLDGIHALVLERCIANSQYFVHQQQIRLRVNRHGEAQTNIHARRVMLDRDIDEVAKLGKIDDLVRQAPPSAGD